MLKEKYHVSPFGTVLVKTAVSIQKEAQAMNEDLYYDVNELIDNALDNFCDGCEDPKFDYEAIEFFGEPCIRQEQICEPGGNRCSRKKEYENIYRLQAAVKDAERGAA